MIVKVCPICDNEFSTYVKSQKYCSLICAGKSKTMSRTVTKSCTECKKEITVKISDTAKKKYCSNECKRLNQRAVCIKRTCLICNSEFSTYNKIKRYCSKACAGKSMRKRIAKQCVNCGKEIVATPHNADRKKYCSRKCKQLNERSSATKRCTVCNESFSGLPSKMKTRKYCSYKCSRKATANKVLVRCDWCDNEYSQFPSRINYHKKHYCSKQCHDLDQIKPEIHVRKTCEYCNESYTTTTHQIRKRNSRFCSKECMDNGTRTRNTVDAFYWRKIAAQIRKRDKYTCQLCGLIQKKPSLHVHHIAPGRLFSDEQMDKANHPDNLISLCASCHRKVEEDPNLIVLSRAKDEPVQLRLRL